MTLRLTKIYGIRAWLPTSVMGPMSLTPKTRLSWARRPVGAQNPISSSEAHPPSTSERRSALQSTNPASGPYHLYLGSGVSHSRDVSSYMHELKGAPVVMVDLRMGGYDDDLSDPGVAHALLQAARDHRCVSALTRIHPM